MSESYCKRSVNVNLKTIETIFCVAIKNKKTANKELSLLSLLSLKNRKQRIVSIVSIVFKKTANKELSLLS